MKIKSALFLAVLLLLLFIIFKSNFFVIKQLDVTSEKANCIDINNLKEKSNLAGQNFFLVDEKKVEEALKRNFICIKNINFSKSLPDKIKLNIVGRVAVANFYLMKNWEASASALIENTATPSAEQIGDAYFLDDEGVIFSKGDSLVLPKIYFFEDKPTDDYLKKTLKILSTLRNLSINNSQNYIFNNFFITTGQSKIVFNLSQDIDVQIASLQLIVQNAKIDSSKLEFIDLRFDKPVVKYAPKK